MLRVSTDFESGRAEVLDLGRRQVSIAVPADVAAPRFRQWFALDVRGTPGRTIDVRVENAGDCTWADAFGGLYRPFGSYGDGRWFRLDAAFDGAVLAMRHRLDRPCLRVACYPPYASLRLARLRRVAAQAGRVEVIGRTPGGRPLEVWSFGPERGPAPTAWIIAQQHPGEHMAGWFVEGLVQTLASEAAAGWRRKVRVRVVPRMNPDGAAIGNHRTTPAGVDLNRAWNDAAPPVEVAVVRERMRAEGAALFLDIHGDERIPWVFAQAGDPPARRKPAVSRTLAGFSAALLTATRDFQTEHGYPPGPPGPPSLAFASNWAEARCGAAAITIEMPFSDHASQSQPSGFSPVRARALGAAVASVLEPTLCPRARPTSAR